MHWRDLLSLKTPADRIGRAVRQSQLDALVRLVGKPIGRSREGHVLVRGPALTCRSYGSAGRGRTDARCRSAQHGDLETAQVLLDAGADVDVRADNQQRPLDLALMKGQQAMVDFLESKGAKL